LAVYEFFVAVMQPPHRAAIASFLCAEAALSVALLTL
jgi:hypothetical protein